MIFEPSPVTTGATIVASFDGQTPASRTAAEWNSLREDFERERELSTIARIMHQRTGVCG